MLALRDDLQDGEVLVESASALLEGHAGGREVITRASDPRRDGELTTRELADAGDLFCEQARIAERQDEAVDREPDPPDATSHRGERREALEEIRVLLTGRFDRSRGGSRESLARVREVIVHPDIVVSARLRLLRDREDVRRGRERARRRERDAESRPPRGHSLRSRTSQAWATRCIQPPLWAMSCRVNTTGSCVSP